MVHAVARVFGQLWLPEQDCQSFAPIELKMVIDMFSQVLVKLIMHDAQKILLFLLNKVHEGLSCVQTKLPAAPQIY